MRQLFGREKLARTITFSFIAVLSAALPSCASATSPCVQLESGMKAVGGHNSFQFRRDWIDFRSDLADFGETASKQDTQELREASSDLIRSIAAIKRYTPKSAGMTCEAFAVAKVTLNASLPRLEQITASADWTAASKLASELTDTSEQLREALPSSWFTRQRHGRHFH